MFRGVKVLDGMLFRGSLPSLTKPGFTAVDTFVSHYQEESGMYLRFFYKCFAMCTAYTNLANTFLISFLSKKQRSVVDA